MTDQEAKDRMLIICNSLNAQAGIFYGKQFNKYSNILLKAEEFILKEMFEKEKEYK